MAAMPAFFRQDICLRNQIRLGSVSSRISTQVQAASVNRSVNTNHAAAATSQTELTEPTLHVPGKAAYVDAQSAEVNDVCQRALLTLGYTTAEAFKLREIMMYSHICGDSQALNRLTDGLSCATATQSMIIKKESALSTLIDGRGTNCMLVLERATQMAMEKAKARGFGIVGTNYMTSSSGTLPYYAEQLGRQGLIALILVQSAENASPYSSNQGSHGSNPICVSVPTSSGPVTMDLAATGGDWLSLLQEGDVNGSHTGSNLSVMVELLAGPIAGAAIQDKIMECQNGNLVIAIDPLVLGDPEETQKRIQEVLDRARAAESLPGVDSVLLPGECRATLVKAALALGVVPVEANLLSALTEMADKYKEGDDYLPAIPEGGLTDRGRWGMATRLVHPFTGDVQDSFGAMSPPLYQTSTYQQPNAVENGPFIYTRSGNPTRALLEAQVANLDGADQAFAFTSGMMALSAVCRLVKTGDHIVASDDIYGGTWRLLDQVVHQLSGVDVVQANTLDLVAFEAAFIPGKTKLAMLESPTNPRLEVCDLRALCAIAHKYGALVMVDNSVMTPVYQKPLQLGADISMISATKFVGGHSDVTGGILSVKGKDIAERLAFLQNAEGGGLAPMDCWLCLRGLKTMSIRMEKSVSNALAIAQFLDAHPRITEVKYPSLPGTASAALNAQQASSGGALVSFTTGNSDLSRHIVEKTELFSITVSFGSTSSLISLPCFMSHRAIPAELRAEYGLQEDLVRISTGIEDVDDLLADLAAALDSAPP